SCGRQSEQRRVANELAPVDRFALELARKQLNVAIISVFRHGNPPPVPSSAIIFDLPLPGSRSSASSLRPPSPFGCEHACPSPSRWRDSLGKLPHASSTHCRR